MTIDPGPDERPAQRARSAMGGGAPLALLILLGVIVGGVYGEPSLGFLAGLGAGIAVAVAMAVAKRG